MAKDGSSSNKYYLKNREKILARLNEAYRSDPEFRREVLERSKRRYHEDEEYRRATIERAKRRYQERKADKDGDGAPLSDATAGGATDDARTPETDAVRTLQTSDSKRNGRG